MGYCSSWTVPSRGVKDHPCVATKTKPKAKIAVVTLSPDRSRETDRRVQMAIDNRARLMSDLGAALRKRQNIWPIVILAVNTDTIPKHTIVLDSFTLPSHSFSFYEEFMCREGKAVVHLCAPIVRLARTKVKRYSKNISRTACRGSPSPPLGVIKKT